ncbi:ABC transporter permease [Ruminococcus sp. Marseille-P6503]|uniref:ABC transporter permease n=1 Tax=Ruminococcus sp. Marseille-P6503 TaxID=2364796 RepID=UPI000F54037E|nr:ABC transporter permease [Ruminococcus sp. Marseille-P6503]
MLTLLFRKMRNTKWMVLCLLIGFIMASAMMSTIPIYMNASLQRMLVKDMEAFQLENDIYPGAYNTSYSVTLDISAEEQRKEIDSVSELVTDSYDDLDCPALTEKKYIADEYLYVTTIDVAPGESASRLTLGAMTGIEDHVSLTSGRMYESGQRGDGVYEVITTERALKVSGLVTGTVYEIANVFDQSASIKIEIVGTFDVADENDSYWAEGLDSEYLNTMFMDYDLLYGSVLDTGAVSINAFAQRYAMDYQHMNMNNMSSMLEKTDAQALVYSDNNITFNLPAASILEDYGERASRLRLILWLLQIPVIMMILVYLFMVSQLNVEQEKNEIAVFKSRGASRFQIMLIYAMESLFLGVITAVTGPFAGMGLCRILGASNGFLEFVNRKSLPISMTKDAFLYAGIAVIVFFVTTMVPIVPATKTTIVEHKQSKAKKKKFPLWEKLCLDFILAGGSIAWLYFYNDQQEKLISEGLTDTTATVNPLMFIASTAFILGLGLFFIRIYPALIRLVARIGKRFWSPSAYVSLSNIGRCANGRERFLMIFLILTVSLGVFFANTARALNRNAEERVSYSIGADVTMAEEWESSKTTAAASQPQSASGNITTAEETEEESDDGSDEIIQYIEPVFERFENLAGVNSATKVFIKDEVTIQSGKMKVSKSSSENDDERNPEDFMQDYQSASRTSDHSDSVKLMTVIPSEFSKVCWFEDRLLPVHINEYLNALSEYNAGVILSSSFRDKYGLELGDTVNCSWGANEEFETTILAFVDYWPAMNPYETDESGNYKDFAIMNFDYVRVQTTVEPYQVWIDLDDGTTTEEFYDSIENSDIDPTMLNVKSQEIISEKTDPMLQGMNGALTLGFIIIMIMCIIGFLIYWILSIKSRTLQFGILRAMGMSYGGVIAMIIYEQLLVSGVSIFTAIFIGGAASDLFVPLFQSLYDASEQVPGFAVIPLRSDYLKLYAVIAVMLLTGFAVLGRLISKIKISQALKLGED